MHMICHQWSNGWDSDSMAWGPILICFPLHCIWSSSIFTIFSLGHAHFGNLSVLVNDLLYWEIWARWALRRANIGFPFELLIFINFWAHDTPKWQFSKFLQLIEDTACDLSSKGSTNPKFPCSYNLYYCPNFGDTTRFNAW